MLTLRQHRTSAARAIDRASLRTLRAKRLHDEEKELEAREQAQAFPNADSPPADTSGMFGFAQPTAVSRAALQRLRAARMHSEERALDGVGEIETEDQENAAVETSVQSACVDLLKDDCVPSSVLQPQTNMIVIGRPSRAKLQKLRAARLHAEEQELEAIATAPRQETQSFLFCGPSMQQMRASRVHSEEQGLYSGDRRRLQQLRAQRLHAEERRLDATASGRLVAH